MTPREPTDVRIRPYTLDDVDALYEAGRESIEHMHPWMPWCHPEYSREEALDWVTENCRQFEAGEVYSFIVVDADGRFLGGCGLNNLNGQHHYANLGYWLRASALGKGIATQAVRLLRDYVLDNTEFDRLEIIVAVDNADSHRVAERVGAVREGVLREAILLHDQRHDAVIYSLLRSDPR